MRRRQILGGIHISKDWNDRALPTSVYTDDRRQRWDTKHSSQLCTDQGTQQHKFAHMYWVKNLKCQCSSLWYRQKMSREDDDIHGLSWLYEYPHAQSEMAPWANDPEKLKIIPVNFGVLRGTRGQTTKVALLLLGISTMTVICQQSSASHSNH